MDADALLHPRGPLPPGVYWRRRGLTLLAAVVVLFLLARACAPDGSSPSGVAQSPRPSASHQPAKKPSKSASPSSSPSASGAVQPCRTEDLVLSAKADASTYPAGAHPVLTIGIANKGATPCTRDVGQAAREIKVTSGNDRVWSSDDCSPGGGAVLATLQPGAAPTSFSVTWSRKRSAPGCPANPREAPAGTYKVTGRFGDLTSAPDTFTLG
jgi:hypothetical protein